MEGSPTSFGGWTWWFLTAVVLAIVVNLIADFLKPNVDRYWEGYSTSRRTYNEKKRVEFERRVAELLNDPMEVNMLIYYSAQMRTFGLVNLAISLVLSLIIKISTTLQIGSNSELFVLLGLTTITFLYSLVWYRSWHEKDRLLRTYESRRKLVAKDSARANSTDEQEAA